MAPNPVSVGFAATLFALFQQETHSFFPGTASGKLEIKSFANSDVIMQEPLDFCVYEFQKYHSRFCKQFLKIL